MKCLYPDCRKPIETDFEEVLAKGYGFCSWGHRSVLPGDTRLDHLCECGSKATNQPEHSRWCPEHPDKRWN